VLEDIEFGDVVDVEVCAIETLEKPANSAAAVNTVTLLIAILFSFDLGYSGR
jgi:hypothetical protein